MPFSLTAGGHNLLRHVDIDRHVVMTAMAASQTFVFTPATVRNTK